MTVPTPTEHLLNISRWLARYRFSFASEAQLQAGLFEVLTGSGYEVVREFRLSEEDRLDFLVADSIGIEVKIASSASDVLRQMGRYAQHDRIHGLLLVTTRASHFLPETLCNKPLIIHRLTESAF